jgi:hypothetical protein
MNAAGVFLSMDHIDQRGHEKTPVSVNANRVNQSMF